MCTNAGSRIAVFFLEMFQQRHAMTHRLRREGWREANLLATHLTRLEGLRNGLEHVGCSNELRNIVRGCYFVITANVAVSHSVLGGATCWHLSQRGGRVIHSILFEKVKLTARNDSKQMSTLVRSIQVTMIF